MQTTSEFLHREMLNMVVHDQSSPAIITQQCSYKFLLPSSALPRFGENL
jgi:hypothetical protein